MSTLQEKLTHKKSFTRAVLAPVTSQTTRASSGGLSEEQSAQGRVKSQVYWRYLGAASRTGFALFVIVMAMQQTMLVLGTFALKHWSEGNRESGENKSAVKYLWAYGLLSLSSVILNCLASILMLVFCSLKSSKYLHDAVRRSHLRLKVSLTKTDFQMLHSVLRAPLTFFELTPSGRYVF